jgi:flavin-binding protein dodecin
VDALKGAIDSGKSFDEALDEMVAAAEKGKDSTRWRRVSKSFFDDTLKST